MKMVRYILLSIIISFWIIIAPCRVLGTKPTIRIYQSDIPSVLIGLEIRETTNSITYEEDGAMHQDVEGEMRLADGGVYSIAEGVREGKVQLLYEGMIQKDGSILWKTNQPEVYILLLPEHFIFVNHSEKPIRVCYSLRTDAWGIGSWNGCYLMGREVSSYTYIIEAGETLTREGFPFEELNIREGHYLLAMDFTFEDDHLEQWDYCSEGRYWICETEFDYWPKN